MEPVRTSPISGKGGTVPGLYKQKCIHALLNPDQMNKKIIVSVLLITTQLISLQSQPHPEKAPAIAPVAQINQPEITQLSKFVLASHHLHEEVEEIRRNYPCGNDLLFEWDGDARGLSGEFRQLSDKPIRKKTRCAKRQAALPAWRNYDPGECLKNLGSAGIGTAGPPPA